MTKMFPILDDGSAIRERVETVFSGCAVIVVGVPWNWIAEHEAQALANHGQPLKWLAERGGLSRSEVICVLRDLPWEALPAMDAAEANTTLARMLYDHAIDVGFAQGLEALRRVLGDDITDAFADAIRKGGIGAL